MVMKIALATVDLLPGRERLMPWRTIIEVAKYANMNGVEAEVLTLSVAKDNGDYLFDGIKIKSAPRNFYEFCDYVDSHGYDAVAYPTPWRESLKDLSAFKKLQCRKIAYFPGGSYRWENIYALWKNVGWKTARPYFIDWLTPYGQLMGKLKKIGFQSVIAQSPFTAETCRKGGFDDVRMILPGKDSFETLQEDNTVFERIGVRKRKYLLFSGAPAPIRGASFLLKAIDKTSRENPDVFCLFLMRRDVGSDYTVFQNAYEMMRYKENVQILDVRLSRNELKTIMAHARCVVLPFLLVPSEIPITYFEVMSLGTPVVTFYNGGTTDYLADNVLASSPGNAKELAENLKKIWTDDELYRLTSIKSVERMAKHPTWEQVGRQWLETLIK